MTPTSMKVLTPKEYKRGKKRLQYRAAYDVIATRYQTIFYVLLRRDVAEQTGIINLGYVLLLHETTPLRHYLIAPTPAILEAIKNGFRDVEECEGPRGHSFDIPVYYLPDGWTCYTSNRLTMVHWRAFPRADWSHFVQLSASTVGWAKWLGVPTIKAGQTIVLKGHVEETPYGLAWCAE